MNKWLLSLLLIGCIPLSQAGEISPLERKTNMCMACHGESGRNGFRTIPDLQWQNKDYLVKQLKAFKSKERYNKTMTPVAKLLSDDEIEQIADYFHKAG